VCVSVWVFYIAATIEIRRQWADFIVMIAYSWHHSITNLGLNRGLSFLSFLSSPFLFSQEILYIIVLHIVIYYSNITNTMCSNSIMPFYRGLTLSPADKRYQNNKIVLAWRTFYMRKLMPSLRGEQPAKYTVCPYRFRMSICGV